MWNPQHGGLSGKARRTQNRSRAARISTQEMIAEYFEPNEPSRSRHARPIHVGRRSEFLPAVAVGAGHAEAGPKVVRPPRTQTHRGQLELPLAAGDAAPSQTAAPERSEDRFDARTRGAPFGASPDAKEPVHRPDGSVRERLDSATSSTSRSAPTDRTQSTSQAIRSASCPNGSSPPWIRN